MWYIVSNKILFGGFRGITLFPFIIMNKESLKTNKTFINHEKIHYWQQVELLVLPFFVWYVLEYLFRLIQYRKPMEAYRNISFEREAYANQSNLNYLKERKVYSFLKYIIKKPSI